MVAAVDGLFGLPRKKLSGSSYEQPKHEEKYFASQADVDRFACKPIPPTGKVITLSLNVICCAF